MTKHPDFERIEDLAKATVFDVNGEKVGSVKDVYINDTTAQPDFISINHGLFGAGHSLVPLRGHSLRDGELHLTFEKERIEDAPDLDDNGHLTTEDQDALYHYYGLDDADAENTETQDTEPEPVPEQAPEPIHLRKYVVTETETIEVPVGQDHAELGKINPPDHQ